MREQYGRHLIMIFSTLSLMWFSVCNASLFWKTACYWAA